MLTKSKTKHCIVKKDAAILLTWKQKRNSDMKLPILCPTESLTKRRLSFHTLKPSESLTRMQKTACAPAPKPVSLWLLYKNILVEPKKNNVCERAKIGVSRNHYGTFLLGPTLHGPTAGGIPIMLLGRPLALGPTFLPGSDSSSDNSSSDSFSFWVALLPAWMASVAS